MLTLQRPLWTAPQPATASPSRPSSGPAESLHCRTSCGLMVLTNDTSAVWPQIHVLSSLSPPIAEQVAELVSAVFVLEVAEQIAEQVAELVLAPVVQEVAEHGAELVLAVVPLEVAEQIAERVAELVLAVAAQEVGEEAAARPWR